MKTIFTILLLLITIQAKPHCWSYSCSSVVSLSPSTVGSTVYSGNKCFRTPGSATVVIPTTSSIIGWNEINFETKVNVKTPLICPSGSSNIGFYGTNSADTISMNGNDTIWNDGSLNIAAISSSGSTSGHFNVIATNTAVIIKGSAYPPGSVYYSDPSDPNSRIFITYCGGMITLPLTLISFYTEIKNETIRVHWETVENQTVRVFYSKDGKSYFILSDNATSPFTITDISRENYIKISDKDNNFSPVSRVIVNWKKEEDIIYDLEGKVLKEEPLNKVYIKGGKKYYKIE